jgi:hypothetical protein
MPITLSMSSTNRSSVTKRLLAWLAISGLLAAFGWESLDVSISLR